MKPKAMTNRKPLRSALLALLPLVFAVSVVAPANAQSTDARRIVAVGGAITETLYALGAQDRIVAIDTTSVFPPQVTEKPNVGYMRALSAEGVLAQSPDLILMEAGAGPPQAIELLKSSGIKIETMPDGHGVAAIAEKLGAIAAAVGKEEAGRALAAGVEDDLARLEEQLSKIEPRKRVLFILSLVDGRPMAAGSDTAADAMIALAGGVNVFAGANGYKTVSAEAATELAPDVVVMMTAAGPNHPVVDPFAIPALKATPAGQNNAIVRMDGAYLLGFGPRTADAARDLAARLYPEAIEPAK